MDVLRFSIPEILSLLGVAQCVYLLVYMLFRSGSLRSVFLPALYFLILGLAFSFDFGRASVAPLIPGFDLWQAVAWFMGPPLSVLLILQILQLPTMPPLRHFWVLLLMPVAVLLSYAIARTYNSCMGWLSCPPLADWLVITGLLAGLTSLAAIWGQRGKLETLHYEKAGRDRYWLILTLVFMNLCFLGLMLMTLTPVISEDQAVLARTFLGLGFVYVAGTSLFRIYPQAVILIQRQERRAATTPQEQDLAVKISALMQVQKIYQEPECNRASLARELNVPEATLSRVINAQFGRTVPQFLNEKRVEDAKQLLADTDAAVKVIASEVGFSSLASFNRVFRDVTGESPSAYRATYSIKNTTNK
ncbi:MAG: AraC family transcriptional regulator [Micavibrio aeruginosavorus]|uniref:AraC family transcriptional regulator n=1 Tax=Micavibrio aeruginosavorus TaxID=349221 RepID=A0A7T5R1B1_9BACT|nr:MAG: AraC family transcriptional regulator [Micavibrio aeruginosavorus]